MDGIIVVDLIRDPSIDTTGIRCIVMSHEGVWSEACRKVWAGIGVRCLTAGRSCLLLI